MIINGENLLLGRLATYAAKRLLLGESVSIVNCEKIMVSGKRKEILDNYKKRFQKGSVKKGPFFPRTAALLVKRAVRGMLPYKKEKGRKAFSILRCYQGTPENLKEAKTLENMNVSKLPTTNYISIREISRELGGTR